MKFSALIIAAVVAQAHAWQINFFADENCAELISAPGGSGDRGCTNLPGPALSMQYFSDGQTLQLFGQGNCGPAFLQQDFSSGGCQLVHQQTFSWALIG